SLGIGLATVIGVVRYAAVTLTKLFVPLNQVEVKVSRLGFSNGLTALVLAQLPRLVEGSHLFTDTGIFVNLISPIVITTALFGAIAGPVLFKERPVPEQKPEALDED
ncbi:hypothetical protein KAI10_01725, partial [Candidatus Bathyarchaeota archaeon]|nr:hypothetical protein [Candidatus Bathyarchaeota archaeon]